MSSYLYIVVQDAAGVSKVWMLSVDVSELNCNQVVNLQQKTKTFTLCFAAFKIMQAKVCYHLIGDGQPLPQEGGDHFNNGLVQLWEPLQLLPRHNRYD